MKISDTEAENPEGAVLCPGEEAESGYCHAKGREGRRETPSLDRVNNIGIIYRFFRYGRIPEEEKNVDTWERNLWLRSS